MLALSLLHLCVSQAVSQTVLGSQYLIYRLIDYPKFSPVKRNEKSGKIRKLENMLLCFSLEINCLVQQVLT